MESLATGYGLIEGPTWVKDRGLVFSDVLNGGVYCLGPHGGIASVLPHRKGVGGIKQHVNGGLIVSGRNVSWKPWGGGDGAVLLETEAGLGNRGFNDSGTDAEGRVYVGSLCFRPVGGPPEEPRPGYLHMIDRDGSTRVVADGIELTNGLGVSPKGERLYHSDSLTHRVWVYARSPDGALAPRRPFAQLGERGVPDGLAVADDGSVWVADAEGGCVWVFDPDGELRAKIACPLPMVTSLCFGDDDLRTLYVVTGSRGAGRADAGTVFRQRVDVPGLPVPPARVPIVT